VKDKTVSIPTFVSNEDAKQGQAEWDAYNEAVKRETAVTGGGCVTTAIGMVAIIALLLLGA
jgi:hypothetical protein